MGKGYIEVIIADGVEVKIGSLFGDEYMMLEVWELTHRMAMVSTRLKNNKNMYAEDERIPRMWIKLEELVKYEFNGTMP